MLTDNGTSGSGDWAQVGWLQVYGGARVTYEQVKGDPNYNGGAPYTQDEGTYEPVGDNTYYSTFYNYGGSGEFQFQIHTAAVPDTYISSFKPTEWFTPTYAEIGGEVDNTASQLPGDQTFPETMADSSYDLGSWKPFYGDSKLFFADQAGYDAYTTAAVSGQGGTFSGWDLGCPNSVSSGDTLNTNTIIDAGGSGQTESLASTGTTQPNGPYCLRAGTDGNVVVEDNNNKLLWSPLVYNASDYLKMQGDDNLVLYNGQGNSAPWNAGTQNRGYSSPCARVQSDGNFVVYGTGPCSGTPTNPLWSTSTNWDSSGSGVLYTDGVSMSGAGTTTKMYSANGSYWLSMQSDCNLVLYDSSPGYLWQSNTYNDGTACHLDMQTDGNLVLYKTAGRSSAVWNSGTGSTGSYNHMVVNNSGTFTVSTVQGTVKYTDH